MYRYKYLYKYIRYNSIIIRKNNTHRCYRLNLLKIEVTYIYMTSTKSVFYLTETNHKI